MYEVERASPERPTNMNEVYSILGEPRDEADEILQNLMNQSELARRTVGAVVHVLNGTAPARKVELFKPIDGVAGFDTLVRVFEVYLGMARTDHDRQAMGELLVSFVVSLQETGIVTAIHRVSPDMETLGAVGKAVLGRLREDYDPWEAVTAPCREGHLPLAVASPVPCPP